MKVLFQSRKTLYTVPGGDTIQIIKTKEYLEQMRIPVDISLELEPDVSSYDLVHLFNLGRPQEVYLQALNARRQGKKVGLSTIYVSYAEYEKKGRGGITGMLAQLLQLFVVLSRDFVRELGGGCIHNPFFLARCCV